MEETISPQAAKSRKSIKFVTRAALKRLGLLFLVLIGLGIWGYMVMMKLPGKSYRGAWGPLTKEQAELKEELRRDVEKLAGQIGERNVLLHYAELCAGADFLEKSLTAAGYAVERQEFTAEGRACYNLAVERRGMGRPEEIVVVGAHYDSVIGSPGANDNGSAVAAALALARRFSREQTQKTVRFVWFANEEPPYYHTESMGSLVYAKRCKAAKEKVTAMLSLETIGYYSDEEGSQKYPFPFSWFYPSKGNFLGFVSNVASRKLLHEVIRSFRQHCAFPSDGGAIPSVITGVNWSDHWSFWQQGYPALMVTDTAVFRYPYYHTPEDKPDKIDYERLAVVVEGLGEVVKDLAGGRIK